jgi:hypothetical protein
MQASIASQLLAQNPSLGQQQSSDLMIAQQQEMEAQYRASQAYSNTAYTGSYGYTGLGYGSYGSPYGGYYGGTGLSGGIGISGGIGFGIP